MAWSEYRLRTVVWAEKVEGDLLTLVDIASRWGCTLQMPPGQPVQLVIPPHRLAAGARATAIAGQDWLVQTVVGGIGQGTGAMLDADFVASFEPAA